MKAFRIKAQAKASPGSRRFRCRPPIARVNAPAEYFRQQLRANQRDELIAQVQRRALN